MLYFNDQWFLGRRHGISYQKKMPFPLNETERKMIEMSNICHPKLELLRLKIVEKLYATSNFKKILLSSPLSEIKSENMPWRGKV